MLKTEMIYKNSKIILDNLDGMSESDLVALIEKHNKKYFVDDDPEISDEAFDKIIDALKFMNPNADVLSKIGNIVDQTKFCQTVQHMSPMLSLDKCYDDANFEKWLEKINGDLIAMPKIDGVASSIIYNKNGDLTIAATRGDGNIGENITDNVRNISSLPQKLPKKLLACIEFGENYIEIRGEIFINLSQFRQKFAADFANPRNLAAGAIKQKDAERSRSYGLQFFPYDIRGTTAKSEKEKFSMLAEAGFSMMTWREASDLNTAKNIFIDFEKKREDFDFELDGVVFRANQLNDQRRLGATAHHPRYAIAYKFQGESAQTTLVGVEWSLARSGVITPVALVNPVFVSGAYVSRASLHNLGQFLRLNLCENSLVEINRRGGVIPYLERVLVTKGKALSAPDICPSCQGPVRVSADFLCCANPNACKEVLVSGLIHFCQVLDIDGMGEKIIRKLFIAGFLKTFADIFRLTEPNLAKIERMGKVLAHKLISEINIKSNLKFSTFLQALGIDDIGATVASLLADQFKTIDKLRLAEVEDLLAIHGIGERIAHSVVLGLKQMAAEIEDLLSVITIIPDEQNLDNLDKAHPIYKKSVLFTGKMAHLDRKSAQELVKKYGGKTPSTVTSSLDILVIGDDGSAILGNGKKSTKQKAAEKLLEQGVLIKIMSESEFLKIFNYLSTK